MNEVYYIYNNEAIASCLFLSVLKNVESLDIPRSCLILPLLLDDKTVNYLGKNLGTDLNLEQIISEHPKLFISFNKRYLSLLPITVNSLMLLNKSNQIRIGKNITTLRNIDIVGQELGNRFKKIEEVIPTLLTIMAPYSTEQLYKTLKVRL